MASCSVSSSVPLVAPNTKASAWSSAQAHALHTVTILRVRILASIALTAVWLARIVVLASTTSVVCAGLLLAVVVAHAESGGAVGIRMAFELVTRVPLRGRGGWAVGGMALASLHASAVSASTAQVMRRSSSQAVINPIQIAPFLPCHS